MRRFKTAAAMTVLCAVQAVALGACADLTPHPQYPVSQPAPTPPPAAPTPAPAPPAAPVSTDDTPRAAPTQPVGQSALPPPPGAKVAPPKTPKPGAMLDAPYVQQIYMFAAASSDTVAVGKGDSLARIAKKAGVSIDDLAKANKLEPPYKIKPGDTLTLPGAASEPAAASSSKGKAAKSAKAQAKPEPKPVETVTVAKGDTLARIAKKAGVSIDDLARANKLEAPYKLKLGQTLALSGGGESDQPAASSAPAKGSKTAARTPAAPPAPTSVKVGKGQTLQSIADKAGVPVAELAKLNHLKKPYKVKRGQVIKLPADEGDTAPSSSLPPRGERAPAAPPKATPPGTVTAGRHDTLQTIADKQGVSVTELARLNHLKKPYRIKRGQKIKVPGHAAPEASAPTASGGSYKVAKGDTLYSIARKSGVTPQALADANGLDTGAHLKVGRRLQLPGGPLDRPAPYSAPSTPPVRAPSREPSQPVPYSALPANPPTSSAPGLAPPPSSLLTEKLAPYTRPNAPPPAAAAAPSMADADVANAGRGFFLWPVRGRLLAGFGVSANGQRNAGMDISGSAGDPVRAAAAGEVVYSGNSVPGYGNLVLIRHDGGWVTAYAHLQNLDVKMRQTVAQGQQIGQVGTTGGVTEPQLHFEVRYAPNLKDAARPIDPMLVLPSPLP